MPAPASTGSKKLRTRRARGSINPADIVAGAFEFCRDTPVDELSMPRLAAHLDVGVTSIYWYFKSKRELLEAMTEQVLASFYEGIPPLNTSGWEDMLRDFFVNFYTQLASDELKCDLIVRRIGNRADEATIHSWQRAEELLAALVDAGFPLSLARHAFFTLSIYTQGFLLVGRGDKTREKSSAEAESDEAPASSATTVSEDFEFGITNTIRGLRLLLPEGADAHAVA